MTEPTNFTLIVSIMLSVPGLGIFFRVYLLQEPNLDFTYPHVVATFHKLTRRKKLARSSVFLLIYGLVLLDFYLVLILK